MLLTLPAPPGHQCGHTLIVKVETIRLLKENVEKIFITLGQARFGRMQKELTTKEKILKNRTAFRTLLIERNCCEN